MNKIKGLEFMAQMVFRIPAVFNFMLSEAMKTYDYKKTQNIINFHKKKYHANIWLYLFSEFIKSEIDHNKNPEFTKFFIEMYNFFTYRNFFNNKIHKTTFLLEFKKTNLYKKYPDISKHLQKTLIIPKKLNLAPHLYWWCGDANLIDTKFLSYFTSFNWTLQDAANFTFPDYTDYKLNTRLYTYNNSKEFCDNIFPSNTKPLRKAIANYFKGLESIESLYIKNLNLISTLQLKTELSIKVIERLTAFAHHNEHHKIKMFYNFLLLCQASKEVIEHNKLEDCFALLFNEGEELSLLIKTFNSIKRKIPNFNFKFKEKSFMSLYKKYFELATNLNLENAKIHQERIFFLRKLKFYDCHFVIPTTTFELLQIGFAFQNCLQDIDYSKSINQNEFFVFALYNNSKPSYCVQVSIEGKVLEIKGKHNTHTAWYIGAEIEELIKHHFSNGV